MNTEETMLALLAEEWVVSEQDDDSRKFKLKDGDLVNSSGDHMHILLGEKHRIYKAPDWRVNIPRCGILGAFYNGHGVFYETSTLVSYAKGDDRPYVSDSGEYYKNFEPLNEMQVRELCDKWIKAIPEVGL